MDPQGGLPQPAAGLVSSAAEVLRRIAADLDSHFLPVGTALAEIVGTVDTVVAGLADVQRAFGPDEGGMAIGDLLAGAERLAATPARQADRGASIEDMRTRLKALATLGDDLDRVIHILEIYTINIKIAAAGSPDFANFADEMRAQLASGRKEVAALSTEVDRLLKGLARVHISDNKLASECAKVIPAVPDRLTGAARSVQAHQQRVGAVAAKAGEIAGQIRQLVGAALGTIQVGDSARQRIEHIVLGCRMLDELAGSDDRSQTAPVLRLCIAQLSAIGEDFARDAGQLLGVLRKLVPESQNLLDRARSEDAVVDSGAFISQMETAVLESYRLTEQMRAADDDAASTLKAVTMTMQSIAAGVMRVQDLGREVGYMSVNANLRCRDDVEINRPVSVIAREIKSNSNLIDACTADIVAASRDLIDRSDEQIHVGAADPVGIGTSLSSALESLRAASVRTATGMSRVDVNATELSGRIAVAISELEDSMRVVRSLGAVIADLSLLAHDDGPVPAGDQSQTAWIVMERMKSAYTMACEREVHNRHLLPGMNPCVVIQRAAVTLVDEEDLDNDAFF